MQTPWKTTDYLVEVLGGLGLIALIVLPIYYFGDLPEQIPKHYNASGQPDSFGSRGSIWVLPVIGIVIYTGLSILNRFPHVFNYPVRVTRDNAARLYTIATSTMRAIKVIIVWSFAFINFRTIEIALGMETGLGKIFLPVFVGSAIVLTVVMVLRMVRR